MHSILWEDTYRTRVPLLDAQNKHLMEMLNVLFSLQQEQPDSNLLTQKLWDTLNHLIHHFKQEELLYEQYVPEELEEHRYQHVLFQDNLKSYCFAVVEGENENSHALCEYIREWVVFHILHMDKNSARKIKFGMQRQTQFH